MRGTTLERDWTKGSIIGNLWSLSWPILIGNGSWVVGWTVDMIWVGKLGAASVAGVGVSGIIVMVTMSTNRGFIVGARAMVARFVGAGDVVGANHAARQALVISATYSVVIAAIGVLLAESLLILMGLEADVIAEGAVYMRIMFIGWITMSFWIMAEAVIQASGDTVTPMRAAIFAMFLQLALAPFLVFGWWIFPRMGVSGAALANLFSQSLGTTICLRALFTGRTRLRLTLSNFRLDLNIIWRIMKIGIPASIMGMQRSLGNLAVMWFMSPFGTLAVAAHSLSQRIETFLLINGMSMGQAAGVLVGQNLGADQPERAERSGWLATGLVEGFMVACSVAILLWAESIIGIFSTEPGLVEIGSTFLRIATAGYLVMGFVTILQQCLSGAGDTVPPMLVSLIMVWLVQLPLAFFLPRVTGLGVYGVRWAIVAGMVTGAVAYIIYFRLGRWKRKKV